MPDPTNRHVYRFDTSNTYGQTINLSDRNIDEIQFDCSNGIEGLTLEFNEETNTLTASSRVANSDRPIVSIVLPEGAAQSIGMKATFGPDSRPTPLTTGALNRFKAPTIAHNVFSFEGDETHGETIDLSNEDNIDKIKFSCGPDIEGMVVHFDDEDNTLHALRKVKDSKLLEPVVDIQLPENFDPGTLDVEATFYDRPSINLGVNNDIVSFTNTTLQYAQNLGKSQNPVFAPDLTN